MKIRKIFLDQFPEYPEHLSQYMYLKNSGLLSIIYMIDHFKPKRIILFGFNFYQGEMIKDTSQKFTIGESKRTSRQELCDNFQKLCNSHKNIEFYRYDEIEMYKLSNLFHISTNI